MPGRNAFPHQARLTTKRDFDAVFRDGRKVADRAFVCYVARREGRQCRLGVAVSRRVGRAVVRNRIKRCIREYFRTHAPEFVAAHDVVVVVRPEAAPYRYAQCADALDRLLRRGGLVRG
ncbi:MAG TPA: ribonuclease P protein component [Candidatus Hydrogenedentes bacterium]|nr:ribonuclease P protein component [Candidatus Hydrogenedentota bacterium]